MFFLACSGRRGPAQPHDDVKSLHAKIGELTLEDDWVPRNGRSWWSVSIGWRTNPKTLARLCKLSITRVRSASRRRRARST